jgi:energy-converting hydrogenase Eha subunit G
VRRISGVLGKPNRARTPEWKNIDGAAGCARAAFYLGAHISFNIPNGWRAAAAAACEGIFLMRRAIREERNNSPLRNIRNL